MPLPQGLTIILKPLASIFRKQLTRNYRSFSALKDLNIHFPPESFEELYNTTLYEWREETAPIRELFDLFNSHNARWGLKQDISDPQGTQFTVQLKTMIGSNEKYAILRADALDIENAAAIFLKRFNNTTTTSSSTIQQLQSAQLLQLTGQKENKPESSHAIQKFTAGIAKEPYYIPRSYGTMEDLAFHSRMMGERTRHKLITAIKSDTRIIVLGDGGSGKSVDLIQTTLNIQENDPDLIPVFRSLGLMNNKAMKDFLPEGWELVPKEKLLLVLDGLDEVPPQHKTNVISEILLFGKDHPETRMVVSCRSTSYQYPIEGRSGTLKDFTVLQINDLSIDEIKKYAKDVFSINGEQFLQDSIRLYYYDLIGKPFFLKELLIIYQKNNGYPANRKVTFEKILDNIFIHDENHFQHTISFDAQRATLKQTLKKISMCMEMMGKNTITRAELDKLLPKPEDIEQLKFFPGFTVQTFENGQLYKFVHNNIQELLAATYLAEFNFDQIISMITVVPGLSTINTSWVNTIGFLFGILEKTNPVLQQLITYMSETGQEHLLVQFEKDKVEETLRVEIFNRIYENYIASNIDIGGLIRYRALAVFCESAPVVKQILNDLENSKTTEQLTNAVNIVRYFTMLTPQQLKQTEEALIQILATQTNEALLIDAIESLVELRLTSKGTLDFLVTHFKSEKRNELRNAVYMALARHTNTTDYFDYYQEGFNLYITRKLTSRNSIVQLDTQLQKVLTTFVDTQALDRLIDLLLTDVHYLHYSGSKDLLEAITDSMVILFQKDPLVYNSMLRLLDQMIRWTLDDEAIQCIRFFDETATRQTAFGDLFRQDTATKYSYGDFLAELCPPEGYSMVIEKYRAGEVDQEAIQDFWRMLRYKHKEKADQLELVVGGEPGIVIDKGDQADYIRVNQLKLSYQFAVLFDKSKLIEAANHIFSFCEKPEIDSASLSEIRREQYSKTDPEEFINESALELLRDILWYQTSVTQAGVAAYLDHPDIFDIFRTEQIREILKKHTDFLPTPTQMEYLAEWSNDLLAGLDFDTAYNPTLHRNVYDWKAVFILFCCYRLDLVKDTSRLLDMLVFDASGFGAELTTEWFVERCGEASVTARILSNMKGGLAKEYHALMTHVNYILDKQLKQGYPDIEQYIETHGEMQRQILTTYLKKVKELSVLKQLWERTTPAFYDRKLDIGKAIRDRFFENSFLHSDLLTWFQGETDPKKRLQIAYHLTWYQDTEALAYLKDAFIADAPAFVAVLCQGFNELKDIKTIDLLFEVLTHIYRLHAEGKYKESHDMRYLENGLAGSIFAIGTQSEANYQVVKQKYLDIESGHAEWKEHTRHISYIVQTLGNTFQAKAIQAVTIDSALRKIGSLSL